MNRGRIVVTGGNGRLGRAVAAELGDRAVLAARHQLGHDTIVTDSDGNLAPGALQGVEAVINCAGRATGDPFELARANINYALRIARTAREAGVRRFIQVSSFSVYGAVERIDENTPIHPVSEYGRSKASAEEQLAALGDREFHLSCVRLPFMFSAADPALIERLVRVMMKVRAYPVRTDCVAERSMMTYGGAARLLVQLADLVVDQQTAAAADPQPFRLDWLAAKLDETCGIRTVRLPLPRALALLIIRTMPGVGDRILRSSVLARSANAAPDQGALSVSAEITRYLSNLRL